MRIPVQLKKYCSDTKRASALIPSIVLSITVVMSTESLAWPIHLKPQITLLRIGTGSMSRMYFPLGTRLAEIFNRRQATITYCSKPPCKNSKILTLAQIAGDSKANIEELARKTIELGLVSNRSI